MVHIASDPDGTAELIALRQRVQELEQANAALEAELARWRLTDRPDPTPATPPSSDEESVTDPTHHPHVHAMLLQQVLDHAPLFVYAKDTQGRYIMVNQTLASHIREFFGYPQMLNRTAAEIDTDPAMANLLNAHDQQVLQTGETLELEQTVYGIPGPWHMLAVKFPIYDRAGSIIAVGGVINDITAHKQSEHALHMAKEQFRIATDLMTDTVYELDLSSGAAGIVNLENYPWALQRMFQPATDERWQRMLHPDDRDRVLQARDRLIHNDEPFQQEYRVVLDDGQILHLMDKAAVLRDDRGTAHKLIGVTSNITERKRAELALMESEQRYRSLFDASPGALLFTALDSTIRSCNQQAVDLFGFASEKELIDTRLIDLVSPAISPNPLHHLRMIVHADDVRNLEHVMCRADGTSFDVEISSSVLRTPTGEPMSLIVGLRDISERKRAQRELWTAYSDLHHSQNLLRDLFDGLHDGLVLLDSSGAVQIINRALAALLDSTPDMLVGQSWDVLFASFAPNDNTADLVPTCWFDGTHPRQTRRRSADGMIRVFHIATIALRDASKSAPYTPPDTPVDQVIVHITDATERLQLQMRAINHERFAAGSKLAASIAHEINTPLLSLDFSLEMAQIGTEQERHTSLAEARAEIQRIARIVQQLLNLYRPGATTREPVDIHHLLERVLLLIGKWMRDQQIVIERDLGADVPLIAGYPDELMQVLLNLLSNAVHAMPGGGILRIGTRVSTTPLGRAILVTVGDTGHGIDPDFRARIFDPFVTTRNDGTGLGLPISKQIVERYGGEIRVTSTPGTGSTFVVTLPLMMEHEPTDDD